MHPAIARFLDLSTAVSALEKARDGGTLDPQEAALAEAALRSPDAATSVLKSKGKKQVAPSAQEALILLGTRAATTLIEKDATLGPLAKQARDALVAEGASQEEAFGHVATAVLEEAFGYAEDPKQFDESFLAETLRSLVVLSKVTQATIDDWLDGFAGHRELAQRPMALKVAETLLEAAWGDGPQPISPEHLDDALDQLSQAVASKELERVCAQLAAFVVFLAEQQVVGRERAARLTAIITSAAKVGVTQGDDSEEPDDDEE